MITVKFLGGAKKIFGSDKLEIKEKSLPVNKLLLKLQSQSEESQNLDFSNFLVAINGVDSSALEGKDTEIRSGDIVSIIPVVHGGSRRIKFKVQKYNVEIMEVSKKNFSSEFLDFLRKKFPKLKIQGVCSSFVLNPLHAKKILRISIDSQKRQTLLSNKLETDIIMRFAGTTQISQAISEAGMNPQKNLILIAVGEKKSLDKLFYEIKPKLMANPFSKKNDNFLKKRFGISNPQIKSVVSKTPLEDLLAEKAAVLVR